MQSIPCLYIKSSIKIETLMSFLTPSSSFMEFLSALSSLNLRVWNLLSHFAHFQVFLLHRISGHCPVLIFTCGFVFMKHVYNTFPKSPSMPPGMAHSSFHVLQFRGQRSLCFAWLMCSPRCHGGGVCKWKADLRIFLYIPSFKCFLLPKWHLVIKRLLRIRHSQGCTKYEYLRFPIPGVSFCGLAFYSFNSWNLGEKIVSIKRTRKSCWCDCWGILV